MKFLTDDELVDLTGYKQAGKQAQWLSENGYKFELRSDGRPNVLARQVYERQGVACPDSRDRPEPDLSWME